MISRREWIARSAAGIAASVAASGFASLLAADALFAAPSPVAITVYKDPGCDCCRKWVEHLSHNGFVPTVHDTSGMAEIKLAAGVPLALQSCHTAYVGRYVIEGHVPADLIARLVRTHPADLLGLTIPGMPQSAPGMDMGHHPYDVIAFTRSGGQRVYARR